MERKKEREIERERNTSLRVIIEINFFFLSPFSRSFSRDFHPYIPFFTFSAITPEDQISRVINRSNFQRSIEDRARIATDFPVLARNSRKPFKLSLPCSLFLSSDPPFVCSLLFFFHIRSRVRTLITENHRGRDTVKWIERGKRFDGNPDGNDRGGLRSVTLISSFTPEVSMRRRRGVTYVTRDRSS